MKFLKELINTISEKRNILLIYSTLSIIIISIFVILLNFNNLNIFNSSEKQDNNFNTINYKIIMNTQFPAYIIVILLIPVIFIIAYGMYFILKKLIKWNREKRIIIQTKREDLLNKFYKTDKKIEKKDYHPKIINLLENIIQESKRSNFKDIKEIAKKKLEFCKDIENIGNLHLIKYKLRYVLNKAKYLAEKADQIYFNKDYLNAINYWKEVIDLYNILLEKDGRDIKKTGFLLKIFHYEQKIINAYINRSEKYYFLALNAIKKHRITLSRENLIISIDSYQNTLAEIKKYKSLSEKYKDNNIIRSNYSTMNDFDILITSEGVKISFYNIETDLRMHFLSENGTIFQSIQLYSDTFKKLKECLKYSSIIDYAPNQIII
ncbi:MAG: hypothetical protein JXA99_02285 [Candidatus Lokiarchaeota archaeon]|nr:hypothetical protein [Candidatus Lokiarchaeota archaeon]